MHIYYIKENNQQYAVLPKKEFEQLLDRLEELEDLRDLKKAKASKEERLPAHIVHRILDGESPVKVFRKYRELTQKELANEAKITRNYLSMLEQGKRIGTKSTLKAIATALKVSIDDLI